MSHQTTKPVRASLLHRISLHRKTRSEPASRSYYQICEESKWHKLSPSERAREAWRAHCECLKCPVGGMSEGSRAILLIFHSLILLSPSTRLTFMDGYVVCSWEKRAREMPQTNRDIIQVSESKGRDQPPRWRKRQPNIRLSGETIPPIPQEIRGDQPREGGVGDERTGTVRRRGSEGKEEFR